MKVAAYCRVSTDKDDQLNSYENQQSYFNREIRAHGHEVYAIYPDYGLTGTRLNNRPKFFEMLRDAGLDIKTFQSIRGDNRAKTRHTVYEISEREPLFDEIWIKNTSRFARNTMSYELINLLRQKGVNIFFIEQNINSNDLGQDLLLKLMQIFDEQDSKDKSVKVMTGIRESANNGVIRVNSKIYGFKYNKETNSLSVIPEEAAVVKQIFELYSTGIGTRRIINILTNDKCFTRSGKPFSKSSISRILSNEKYAGYNNLLKYDTGIVFAKNYPKVKDEYRVEECDRIEPIVSKDLFDLCQEIRQTNVNYKAAKGKYNGITKYGKLLVCGMCGENYTSNMDDGRRFYNCSGKKAKRNGCTNRNISEKRLDVFVNRMLGNNIERYISKQKKRTVSVILTMANEMMKRIDVDKEAAKRILQDKIDSHTKKLEGYYELYADESSRRDILKRMIDKTNEEIQMLESELRESAKGNDEIMIELALLRDALIKAEKQSKVITPKTKEEMIEQINTIRIVGDTPEVRLKIPKELESINGMNIDEVEIDTTLDIAQVKAELFNILG